MTLPLPSTFYPELTNDRLTDIANELLDLRHETLSALSSEWDDAYTKESAVFGRCRNRLIGLCKERDWLSVSPAGMAVTLCIGKKVPFRFFRDDPENPRKRGFFKQNRTDDLFPVDMVTPVMWRFIIDRAMTEDDEDRVYFAGFNELQDKVSLWEHKPGISSPYAVDDTAPKSKQLPPAAVRLKGSKGAVDTNTKITP